MKTNRSYVVELFDRLYDLGSTKRSQVNMCIKEIERLYNLR